MAETIGSRLKSAREAKGMSIEDVAFETRIRSAYLRSLEADDYSNFASTTYAKSFLTLYSQFLGVEVESALHYFAGTDDIRLLGQPHLAAVQPLESVTAPKVPRSRNSDKVSASVSVHRERPGLAPIFMGLVVLLLISAIPILWFLGKDAESIDDVTVKAKEIVDSANSMATTIGGQEASDSTTSPNATPPGESSPTTSRPRLAQESREVAAPWLREETSPLPTTTEIEPSPPSPGNSAAPGDPQENASDQNSANTEASTTVAGSDATDPGSSEPTPGVDTPPSAPSPVAPENLTPGEIATLVSAIPPLPRTPSTSSDSTTEEEKEEEEKEKPSSEAPMVAEVIPESGSPANAISSESPEPEESTSPSRPLRAEPLIAEPLELPESPGSDDSAPSSDEPEEKEEGENDASSDEEDENGDEEKEVEADDESAAEESSSSRGSD